MTGDDLAKNVTVYGGHMLVPSSLLDDAADVRAAIEGAWDGFLHPWKYPDRNPFPHFDLFPRLTRLLHRLRPTRPEEDDNDD